MLNGISESQKDKYYTISLTRVVRFMETESRMAVAGAGGGENEEFVFNGYRASACKAEKMSGDEWWMVTQQCECI